LPCLGSTRATPDCKRVRSEACVGGEGWLRAGATDQGDIDLKGLLGAELVGEGDEVRFSLDNEKDTRGRENRAGCAFMR